VLGEWPGLGDGQLYENRDLALTTDFRDVFAEAAQKHLGAAKMERLFPGYALNPKNYRGILKGA
jgi:uncharacterized protein (DUF1501 family)